MTGHVTGEGNAIKEDDLYPWKMISSPLSIELLSMSMSKEARGQGTEGLSIEIKSPSSLAVKHSE